MDTTNKTSENFFQKYVPITKWLPIYNKSWLTKDVIAGLSVWALMVPQSLGYASISGVPVQYGLYAAGIGLIVYAIFASSRHVVTGPSSTVAAVSGAAVLSAGATGTSQAVALVAAISVVAGILYLIMGFFKLGWISNFLAASVLTGFIFGIGIDVIIGQLGKITGTTVSGENAWSKLASWISGLPDINTATALIGLGTLLLLLAMHKFTPKIPGALVALVGGIAISTYFSLSDEGVKIIGEVPTGLPTLVVPSMTFILDNLSVIISGAIGVFMIALSESIASARLYASKHHYRIDNNQEMLAQGFANTASGLFQGVSVAGSLSKSSLNDSSGAKSQMSSLVQGAFVLVTLLFLAPFFTNLPESVLGAIVIVAVGYGLLNVKEMKRIYRLNRTEFWVAIFALLGVITFGTLQGVIIGLLISILVLIYRASNPAIPLMGKVAATGKYQNIETNPAAKQIPGVAIFRFDAALFFANVNALSSRVQNVIDESQDKIKFVIIDMQSVNMIDLEGADALKELATDLATQNVDLHLANVKTKVKEYLITTEVNKVIGNKNIHSSINDAEKILIRQLK